MLSLRLIAGAHDTFSRQEFVNCRGEPILDTPVVPPSSQQPGSPGGSWRPADHYDSTPASPDQPRRGCKRPLWIGCGIAGCLVLLGLGGIGVYFVTAGAVPFLRWSLTFIERSIDESTDAAVPAEKRAELKRELQRLRGNLRDKEDAAEAQPILLEMNRAISDRRLTAEEVDDLIGRLQKANDRLEGKAEGRRQKAEELSAKNRSAFCLLPSAFA